MCGGGGCVVAKSCPTLLRLRGCSYYFHSEIQRSSSYGEMFKKT